MKKSGLTKTLLSFVLGLSLAGCSSTSQSDQGNGDALYTPGTYTGNGSGMNGMVSATITVDESHITDVQLDVSGSGSTILCRAGQCHFDRWCGYWIIHR